MRTVERPSAHGGCAVKPVVGVANSWPIVCRQVADKVRPARGEADTGLHR